nr:MAG TPA: hypothetical protein [Bacteriophage sp.]
MSLILPQQRIPYTILLSNRRFFTTFVHPHGS